MVCEWFIFYVATFESCLDKCMETKKCNSSKWLFKLTVYLTHHELHYCWQNFKQIIKKPIFGLYWQLNDRNILVSMYRKVRENSRPRDLPFTSSLFTNTKGVVSVIKTSCAHSVTLKRINKTHLFVHFHIVIWTRKLLWKYMRCLSKLLLHELCYGQNNCENDLNYNRCKDVHLFVEEAGQLLEEVLLIHPTIIQRYTICILDV